MQARTFFCEKPFVFAENAAIERQKQSDELLDLARQQGVLLGTQMQYALGVQSDARILWAPGKSAPFQDGNGNQKYQAQPRRRANLD